MNNQYKITTADRKGSRDKAKDADAQKNFIDLDRNLLRTVKSDNRVADSTKAKKILKWRPKFSLDELVVDMVESDLKLLTNLHLHDLH